MKIFVFTVLLFAATQATALQKCIIDGKTLYKSGLCTQGTVAAIPELERQARQGVKIEQQQRAQAELDRQEKQNNAVQQQRVQIEPPRQPNLNIVNQEQEGTQRELLRQDLERQLREVPQQYNSFDEAIAAKNRIKNEQRALGFRTSTDDLSDKVDKLGRQMQTNKVFRDSGQAEPY